MKIRSGDLVHPDSDAFPNLRHVSLYRREKDAAEDAHEADVEMQPSETGLVLQLVEEKVVPASSWHRQCPEVVRILTKDGVFWARSLFMSRVES